MGKLTIALIVLIVLSALIVLITIIGIYACCVMASREDRKLELLKELCKIRKSDKEKTK